MLQKIVYEKCLILYLQNIIKYYFVVYGFSIAQKLWIYKIFFSLVQKIIKLSKNVSYKLLKFSIITIICYKIKIIIKKLIKIFVECRIYANNFCRFDNKI